MKQLKMVGCLMIVYISFVVHISKNISNDVEHVEKEKVHIESEDYDIPFEGYRMVILYDNLNDQDFVKLTQMISKKMNMEIFDIHDYKTLDLSNYDVILIGIHAINEIPSKDMTSILSNIDFLEKNVSFYYIYMDTIDCETFEKTFIHYIHNANVSVGLNLNHNEMKKADVISSIIDGWLTSIYPHTLNFNDEKKEG